MDEKISLSKRELDIMNVLWEANKSLIAKDIIDKNNLLSINTVQAVLKSLLKKNYIKVSEIVYSGTVLTRSYMPILTADEYMIYLLTQKFNLHFSPEGIMAALLKQEECNEEEIENLEKLLNQYKKELKR